MSTYDFMDPDNGRASAYGIYDWTANVGFVNRCWLSMGKERYPHATKLLITAEGGGSNGSRVRLWKTEMQRFVDEKGTENLHSGGRQ